MNFNNIKVDRRQKEFLNKLEDYADTVSRISDRHIDLNEALNNSVVCLGTQVW